MGKILEIKDLHVSIDVDETEKEILKGVNLELETGKIYALMGPNGSGKTSLSNALMGHPKYKTTSGKILFDGEDLTEMGVDDRAKKGVFLSFQYPKEISGVSMSNFLKTAYNSVNPGKKLSLLEFHEMLKEKANLLDMKEDFLERYLNEGFSGGEKKKSEILQLLTLNPRLAVLDETDSGLDIDALRTVAKGVNAFSEGGDKCVLVITHYNRILEYIKPDKVFVMKDGKIVLEEGRDFVNHLEEKGYGWITEGEKIEKPSEIH